MSKLNVVWRWFWNSEIQEILLSWYAYCAASIGPDVSHPRKSKFCLLWTILGRFLKWLGGVFWCWVVGRFLRQFFLTIFEHFWHLQSCLNSARFMIEVPSILFITKKTALKSVYLSMCVISYIMAYIHILTRYFTTQAKKCCKCLLNLYCLKSYRDISTA